MNLAKSGELIKNLRKSLSMTQKQVSDRLGVLPKTVSKWETGHGFPDVSILPSLAELLGVSEKALLTGDLCVQSKDAGNMLRTKFYVCPHCGSFARLTGNGKLVCCGKPLEPCRAASPDDAHAVNISELEDDYYIEFSHPMTKEHYISFVSYVRFDRILTVKLYPEQEGAVRFPKMRGGRFYYFCNEHGLFELQ